MADSDHKDAMDKATHAKSVPQQQFYRTSPNNSAGTYPPPNAPNKEPVAGAMSTGSQPSLKNDENPAPSGTE